MFFVYHNSKFGFLNQTQGTKSYYLVFNQTPAQGKTQSCILKLTKLQT